MYYEEKVINGVLCWRSTPDGEWIQKTPEQLTNRILDLEDKFARMEFQEYCETVNGH